MGTGTMNVKHAPGTPQTAMEYACGWGSAFINITVTFPLNKLMFRQQLDGIRVPKAVKQLYKEGVFNLYRGLLPPLMQKTTSLAIMFGTYHQYKLLLSHSCPQVGDNRAIAAFLSGTTEAILVPFERVQVLLQAKQYQNHYKNTGHAFSELRTNYGLREYYRGLVPVLMRNGPSNILFFLGREEFRKAFPITDNKYQNVTYDFVSGAFLGAFISTVFFPLNVVKTRMQSQVGGEFASLRRTFWIVFEERNRSWSRMFRGVHINYTRSLISWGLVNASYEFLKKLLNAEGS